MKIARVFVTAYPGKAIGDIYDVFDPAHHPGSLISGTIKECEVADDFDMSVMKAVVSEDGSVTFESDSAKVAAKVVAAKTAQITERYNDMNVDVYAEMEVLFKTKNPESAQAYHETWKLMKTKPVLFYESGLKAHKAIGSFASGAALDTIQKVEDYADACLAAAETYGVWRMERIKQFQDEKDAILAG
jgi:hypothetical protein